MTDRDLSKLQLDILELESRTWKLPGEKISAFRQLYPRVTETGYYVALLMLLGEPKAYEYDGRRYASMLRRLDQAYGDGLDRRVKFRTS